MDYEDSPLEPGIKILYKPMGVIGCVMPSTNPVATIIGNAMMALKGRNSVIIAPHPMSVRLSVKMVKLLREALESVGAPADLIQCISEEYASREATNLMMSTCDACISTGGARPVSRLHTPPVSLHSVWVRETFRKSLIWASATLSWRDRRPCV